MLVMLPLPGDLDASRNLGLERERKARLHFAAFIKKRMEEGGSGFRKDMLSGSNADFKAKLESFIGQLKEHMAMFIERIYGGKGASAKGRKRG
jgi:hypothetical protein